MSLRDVKVGDYLAASVDWDGGKAGIPIKVMEVDDDDAVASLLGFYLEDGRSILSIAENPTENVCNYLYETGGYWYKVERPK